MQVLSTNKERGKDLSSTISVRKNGAGFTLIEILVIISVTSVLSAILVSYSRESGRIMLLINNQAKLVSLVSRAKSLSIATFIENIALPSNPSDPKICGYGVHVEKSVGEIFIFKDLAQNCSSGDNRFGSGDVKLTSQLDVLKLDSWIIQFGSDTTLNDVMFIPPDPIVLINNDSSFQEALISIETKDKSGKVIVKVSNAGRISTK